MSVEEFGRRVLGEVKETNLAELFAIALNQLPPSPPPPPTPFHRLLSRIDHPKPPSGSSPSEHPSPAVISLTSLTPESGKSHLIYHLFTHALLPSTFNGIPLHGAHSTAVLLDTEGSFSAIRLAQVMTHYIKTCAQYTPPSQPPSQGPSLPSTPTNNHPTPTNLPTEHELDSLILSSIHHLHIFRPQSFPSLLATVRELPTYLANRSNHDSAGRELWGVVLDSADAFAWEVRAELERERFEEVVREKFGRGVEGEDERWREGGECRTEVIGGGETSEAERDATESYGEQIDQPTRNPPTDSGNHPHPTSSAKPGPYTSLLTALSHLSRRYRCRIITTTSATRHLSPPPSDPRLPYQRIHTLRSPLPEKWNAWHNVRVLIEREALGRRRVKSVEEAREEEGKWLEQGRCGVLVGSDWRRMGNVVEGGHGRWEEEIAGPEEFWGEVGRAQRGWVMRVGREGVEIGVGADE
ncbi:hypothetical protein P152DRAFT_477584 [Eremomyces bilateralis CBS 781.70]|uniref:DNA recombination and repair protein Rad51-like C-terminal domain-containing protein n=1 Tax=Eremomyces bilateralis CBS 781.70 TaxID=1392243 RepID=A0A6G1FR21_9PEZI|nr:uncharacterized protein P152DRAFT_477584 [Eremomyces bilateralis CBS 781.70]KAF1808112.1 hypothetical protein P152DRAFT_477584 [Eremomyces bilateralis CBS 781.70]